MLYVSLDIFVAQPEFCGYLYFTHMTQGGTNMTITTTDSKVRFVIELVSETFIPLTHTTIFYYVLYL